MPIPKSLVWQPQYGRLTDTGLSPRGLARRGVSPGGASASSGIDLATTVYGHAAWTGRMDKPHGHADTELSPLGLARRDISWSISLSEDLIRQPQHGLANTGLFATRASQTKHQPEHQRLQSNPERITTHGGIYPPIRQPQYGLAKTGLFATWASQTRRQQERQPLLSDVDQITAPAGTCPPGWYLSPSVQQPQYGLANAGFFATSESRWVVPMCIPSSTTARCSRLVGPVLLIDSMS